MSRQVRNMQVVRYIQQSSILLLALLGLLLCLVTGYRLTVLTVRVIFAAICFTGLFSAVFSVKHKWIASLLCLLSGLLFVFIRRDALFEGALLLLEQALAPMQLVLPDSLSRLIAPVDTAHALLLTTSALQTLLYFAALFCGYFVVCRSAMLGLALVTLPLLLPMPFYSLAPDTVPFFCLAAAHLMLYVYKSSESLPTTVSLTRRRPTLACRDQDQAAQRPTRQLLSLAALPVVAAAALLSCLILPERDYVRPRAITALQEQILAWDIGDGSLQKSNDGLTHGSLKNLSPIAFSGGTALKVRVSTERALYLRDFAGVVYSGDGWTDVSRADYNRYADGFLGIAPQNLFATALAASATEATPYTLSVQNVSGLSRSIWVPGGLVTTVAEIDGATSVSDTAFAAARAYGVPVYTVTALPYSMPSTPALTAGQVKSAYLATLGSATGLTQASEAEAQRVQSAARAYLDYVFDVYTVLPEKTQAAAERLAATYGLTLDGGRTLYETCYGIYQLLAERCDYAYAPPKVPANADFTTYFLEESQSGYCVHFATAATVLLRSLGIPARYAEGYIVVAEDYAKQPDSAGFISIEDTHAHAWVEVFDPAQLEWIPIEMTASTGGGAASSFDNGPEEAPDAATTPQPTAEPTPEASAEPAPESTPSEETDPAATPEADSEPEATPVPTADADTDGAQASSPSPASGSDETGDQSGGEGEIDTEEGAEGAEADGAKLPRWIVISIVSATGLALAVFGTRRLRQYRLKRQFEQPDRNEAVRAVCRYTLAMLHFSGCAPLLPLQSIEAYATGVSKALPWLARKDLLAVLALAQRARFSWKTCTKQERQDAESFARMLSTALPAHLPRMKRMLFWWLYPWT